MRCSSCASTEAGAHRVTARVDERNTASARLLERLGFRQEATFVDGEWFKGEWTTLEVFAHARPRVGGSEGPRM